MAQMLVIKGFNAALSEGSQYLLKHSCDQRGVSGCVGHLTENIATEGNTITKESVAVSGTRSDLVVRRDGQSPILLEIVVSHWPESPNRYAYKESGFPVYLKTFQWFEDLEGLDSELVADEVINLPCLCSPCELLQQQEEERFERRREIVDRALSGMKRAPSGTTLFRPWYHGKPRDGFSAPTTMFPKTQWPVFANALILTEMGFRQSNPQKPWLFLYQLPKGVKLYADLGGSDVVPIYEDTAAMLYCKVDPINWTAMGRI